MNTTEKKNNKKNLNSYSYLQMKINEVGKCKSSASKCNKSSNSNDDKKGENSKFVSKKHEKTCTSEDSSKLPPQQNVPSNPDEPDRSYGDYYCQLCDSHMNAADMWVNHINGKRHLKNVKKGDIDSKYEDIDDESSIKYELRNVKDPVIGLNYIHEIRRRESGVPPIYNCFLCHASIATIPLVIEHVISVKHRMNFIKENAPSDFKLMEQTNLKKGFLEPILIEKAALLEQKYGRGVVRVKQEKPKSISIPVKRSCENDEQDGSKFKKPFHAKLDDKASVWKSVDISKRDRRIESDDQQDKKNYYYHDDRCEDYRKSHSYRNKLSTDRDSNDRSYNRIHIQDDHRQSPDDYSRLDSLSRYKSPDRNKSSNSSSRRSYQSSNAKYNHEEYLDARQYLEARSTRKQEIAQKLNHVTTPPVKTSITSQNSTEGVKAFVNQLYNLPVVLLLKIASYKLDTCKSTHMGKEEIEFILKIYLSCNQLLRSNLPNQVYVMLQDNINSKTENDEKYAGTLTNIHPVVEQPTFTCRSSASQSPQNTLSTPKFTMDDIHELVFGARKASELATSNQHTHLPTYNSVESTSTSASYSSSSNFTPAAITIPPQVSSLSHPDNFAHQSNNYNSSNNVSSSSYQNYTTYQDNSAIPGFTFSDNVASQNLLQNEYSSYRWPSSSDNMRKTFGQY